MESFLDHVNRAAKGAFPNARSKYKSINALLLSWQDDDLGVEKDIEKLKGLLASSYGCHTEQWKIPLAKPDFELTDRLRRFRVEHETENPGDCLFIVYYAGHGHLNRGRRTMWSNQAYSSDHPNAPKVNWHAHEALFIETIHDTLFLFDCCTAGSSSETAQSGIKEVIAACGFETWAPGDAKHSFTSALIKVLESLVKAPPFTVASLHQKVLENLKNWNPHIEPDQFMQAGPDGRLCDIERRKTPVHITLNQNAPYYHCSIQLVSQYSNASQSIKRTEEALAQWQEEQKEYTDVIISIRVQGELKVDQFAHWITSVPLLAMSITVHAVVNKDPTLVLLALPVAVWDLLPADATCQFVGYANTRNLVFGNEYLFNPEQQYLWSHNERMFKDYNEIPAAHDRVKRLRERFYDDYFRQLTETYPDCPDIRYATGMRRFHLGHAFLNPQMSRDINLGSSGYIIDGKWNTIELASRPETARNPVRTELEPQPMGSGSFEASSCQRGNHYSYRYTDGWGAILLPSKPLIHESTESDGILSWAHSNAQKILLSYQDVKNYGFYVVSGTYTTRDFKIISRDAPSKPESFTIWQQGKSSEYNLTWLLSDDKGDNITKKTFQDEYVVAFLGIYFTYKKIFTRSPALNTVEGSSAPNEPRVLYEFQYTPFIWPDDISSQYSF